MKRTTNFGLYKPESDDYISIDDINANMDIIDEALASISGGSTPVNGVLSLHLAGEPVIGNITIEEET